MQLAAPSTEALLDLVGRFYVAALHPGEIPAALEALSSCLGATFTQTYTYDRHTGVVLDAQISHHPLTDKAHEDYTREWHRYDPRPATTAMLPSGAVLLCHEHFDEEYVARSAFYQEYFIPIGLRWAMGVMDHREDGTSTLLAGLRAPDLPHFDDTSASTLKLVLPHFLRARALAQEVDRALIAASRAESIVEAVGDPALLLDSNGRVLFLNERAKQALPAVGASVRGSHLYFASPAAEASWQSALMRARQAQLSQLAPVTSDAATHIEIIPLKQLGLSADASEARMMLALIRGVRSADDDVRSVARAYGLSEAEADVLQLLASGLPAKEIARRRGASVNTVRSQIKVLLQKTGTRSQREMLVKCFHR